ncbi:MAG: exonuclease SbcCD subunit D, partial [Candidatus Bathyarchaeia archaeon]
LRKLKDAGIPVLAVDGSHDQEPNVLTGTVLIPLHNAGLLEYLPRRRDACWENEHYYVYGLRSCRGLREADEKLPKYLQENPPQPRGDKFNICVFHGTVENLAGVPSFIKADLRAAHLPPGFDYYAGGHIHTITRIEFNGGLLVYPGPIETNSYDEADVEKGFFHVKAGPTQKKPVLERVLIEDTRCFIIREHDFSNKPPDFIIQQALQSVKGIDTEDAILVLVLNGSLPQGFRRSQVSLPNLRAAAKKALHLLIVNNLSESALPAVGIPKGSHEMRTMAHGHMTQILTSQMGAEKSEKLASLAIEILDPLLKNDEDAVRALLRKASDI